MYHSFIVECAPGNFLSSPFNLKQCAPLVGTRGLGLGSTKVKTVVNGYLSNHVVKSRAVIGFLQ
jgi:hypothetical protein